MKILLTLLLTLLLIPTLASSQVLKVDADRLVRITGSIRGDIIEQAQQLEQLTTDGKKPIYILIGSPGGHVLPGIHFINAMKLAKARKVGLICVVPVMAASMAFQFLAYCDLRYVFEDTLLLFHPMKISGCMSLTSRQLRSEAKIMRMYEDKLNKELLAKMKINKKVFWFHYRTETLWTADALAKRTHNFIIVVKNIKGVDNLFKIKKKSTAPWMYLLLQKSEYIPAGCQEE